MPNMHSSNPVPFRPAPGQRERLAGLAATTGQTVNALLRLAVGEFLDKHEPRVPPAGGQRDEGGEKDGGCHSA